VLTRVESRVTPAGGAASIRRPGRSRPGWRRALLIFVLVAAAWALTTHLSSFSELARTAASGSWEWLAIAALLQAGYYACYTFTLQAAFRAVGIRRPFAETLGVILASIFVGTVTPAGAAAGTALIVDDSTRRGHSGGRSAAAVVLFELADFAGFGVVLVAGLGYLLVARRLQGFEVVSAGVFLGIVAAFAGILVIAGSRPHVVATVFEWLERVSAWVSARLRKESPAPWAQLAASDFAASAALIRRRPASAGGAWSIAVAGHVFDVLSLFAIGAAFGWRGTTALLAAYAVGVVVWLTSFVPQGVGLVEGAMALVLISFAVPTATAAAIVLVFRGLTFWLPFACGFVALRAVRTFAPDPEQRASYFAPRVAGVLAGIAGLVNIVSAVTPSIAGRVAMLESVLPLQVQVLYGHLTAAVAGAGLLMLGRGLWHRKRAAWSIACLLLAASAASHILKGLDYEEAIVSAAVLAWLLAEHRSFLARSDRPSVSQALRVVGAAFAITLVYGTVGFWLLDRHFSVNFGLVAALRQTVVMFTNFYNPGLEPITGFGRWFAGSIYTIGLVTFGYALIMVLRSVLVRDPATPAEKKAAQSIVEAYGHSALARTTLLPDKSYHFSAGGSVVAYVSAREVGLALGDPIGPAGDAAAAITGFHDLCARNGWRCAFYQTLPDYLDVYRSAGFEAVSVGEEAIVDVSGFDRASQRKSVRATLRRLANEGYEVAVLLAPHDGSTMRELRSVSDAWLSAVGGREMRFSLGWFDDDYIRGCDVMVMRSGAGTVEAFANIMSEYRADEATIDLMRHRPGAPSGAMDVLFVHLFEWARDAGYSTFNLGLSPLAGVGERPDDPAVERLLQLAYEYGNRFYSFRGLHDYKAKFNPAWESRYLVYRGAAELPAVFAALVQANFGGREPLFERLLRRGKD
jgi:phosphatidylglycerol lysyltransferase